MELVLIAGLIAFGVREYTSFRREQGWVAERAVLLNRIKPETAQPVPGEPVPESLRPVDMFSDDDHWKAREVTHGSNS